MAFLFYFITLSSFSSSQKESEYSGISVRLLLDELKTEVQNVSYLMQKALYTELNVYVVLTMIPRTVISKSCLHK